jgi:hypothetical protein
MITYKGVYISILGYSVNPKPGSITATLTTLPKDPKIGSRIAPLLGITLILSVTL